MLQAGRIHSTSKVEAQFYILGFPTVAILVYLVRLASGFIPLLEDTWIMQGFVFAGGMTAALALFAMRYRFLSISLVVAGVLWMIFRILMLSGESEFEPYFISAWFLSGVLFFVFGWVTGFGLSRVRGYNIFWPIALLGAMIFLMAAVFEFKGSILLFSLAPFIVYAFYIIYTGELIRNFSDSDPNFLNRIGRRLTGFTFLMVLILAAGWFYISPKLQALEEQQKTEVKKPEDVKPDNSLISSDEHGMKTKESMTLSAVQNRDLKDSLLFVAQLDHFFPDEVTPNPLYFVSDYYSKFDTLTQTFETDPQRPFNDLFQPQVLQVPLYFTEQDSSVLRNNMAYRNRQIISAEIYTRALSGNMLVAPSTAFSVQPISVPDEFQHVYRSAYKARIEISELNSAYFVYNSGNEGLLEEFQENRNRLLRRPFNLKNLPDSFLSYYTFMPKGYDYDSITTLTSHIVEAANATTQIDKMLAIRDYFLSKDSNDVPLFRYTDNPGVPGLPSANRLTYFLFQNRKGYCAYFAGATLFMLRSQNIPSRIATGFLPIDRSNKNPGWYWFYGDQAHAWVQVFFPEYGWLDFDTTIPDEEQRQSPQPDQTPPLAAQAPVLVADGEITKLDTLSKSMQLRINSLLIQDRSFNPDTVMLMNFDISGSIIKKDTGIIKLTLVDEGERAVAVSFAFDPEDEIKNPRAILRHIASGQEPVRADEIRIMPKKPAPVAETIVVDDDATHWTQHFWKILRWLIFALLIFFLVPEFMWVYLRFRAWIAGNNPQGLYFNYHTLNYILHIYGYERGSSTPYEFAKKVVDPTFNTDLTQFMQGYLKSKYAPGHSTNQEISGLNDLARQSIKKINRQVPVKTKLKSFLRVNHSIRYFTEEMPVFN